MEKSGRRNAARGRSRLLNARSAIAFAFFLAAMGGPLCALDVDFFVSSYETVTGGEIEMRFTVYGADPGETSLAVESSPPSFTQTSSRKERQRLDLSSGSGDGKTSSTVITQKWIASTAGEFSLGPFTLTSGDETVSLPPVHIAVSEPAASGRTELRWRLPDGGPRSGEPHRLVLEAALYGKAGAVVCDVPENALLEALPLSAGEESPANESPIKESSSPDAVPSQEVWKPVAVWNWTPLGAGTISLPVAVLEYVTPSGEDRKVASPVLSVAVAPAARHSRNGGIPRSLGNAFTRAESDRSGKTGGGTDGPSSAQGTISHPALPAEVAAFPGDGVLVSAAALWKDGLVEQALASLRRAEYTTLFPRRYRAARIACEESLGLAQTIAVTPAAWKPVSVIGSVAILCLALLLRLIGMRARAFARLSYPLFALSLVLAVFAFFVYTRDLKGAGVAADSSLLRVPETSSTVVEKMRSGTAVRILRETDDWYYVETAASLRGWIPSDCVTIYTGTERDK